MGPTDRLTREEIEDIRTLFRQFDRDSSDSIDAGEFVKLLDALGGDFPPEEIEQALRELDTNKNGRIDFHEFLAWWAGTDD